MDTGLQDVVALVVGGSGLIGAAVARALYAEGATVVLAARSVERLEQTATSIGPGVSHVVIDTRDGADVERVVADVVERFGPVGVLVNTAAPSARTLDPSRNSDPAQVLDAFDAKAMGYLRCANAVLPSMQVSGFGRVINISGQNALATKSITGAVRNSAVGVISKNLADTLAGTGVTVNTVHPGLVSETYATAVEPGLAGECSPDQVAAAVVFLASTSAATISGETLAIGHRVRGSIWQ